MNYNYLFILVLLLPIECVIKAQSRESINPGLNYVEKKLVEGDTLPHVNIDEIKVVQPWKFKSERQRKRYSKLVINIKKTLPYARLAESRLKEIATDLEQIEGEKNRKAFLKESEKELFDEFEKPLRKLTYSQGRMLIKLIDRETGDTSYELIKDLKGGFSAFMWQSVARLFGSNLKSEYDGGGDDAMIEHIILMIDYGML